MKQFSKLKSVLFVFVGLIFLSSLSFGFDISTPDKLLDSTTTSSTKANDDDVTTSKNQDIVIYALTNDTTSIGSSIKIVNVDTPKYGTAVISDDKSSITYTPRTDWYGRDDFNYTIEDSNGNQDTATITIYVAEPATDICYQPIDSDCLMSMGGVVNVNCKATTPLRNLSNDPLTDVKVVLGTSTLFSALNDCGVDDTSGNCEDSSSMDIMMVSFFSNGIEYTLPDYNGAETHSTYTKSMISFFESGYDWVGTYTKNGVPHRGQISPCSPVINFSTKTGPFDAWDTFRNGISDRNISTKIVDKKFKLVLDNTNITEPIIPSDSSREVKVAIYPKDSTTPISNEVRFYAGTRSYMPLQNFNVTQASKDATVGFKICATYKDEKIGDTTQKVYRLYNADKCADPIYSCDEETDTPKWHLCSSTDNLAIRPKSFDVNITNENNTFIAERNSSLEIVALTEDNKSTPDYNESEGSSFDVSLNSDNDKCAHKKGDISPNINFKDGNYTNNSKFNRVGDFDLNISEIKDQEFASVDSDDREIPTKWSKAKDLPIEPKIVTVHILPAYFTISGKYYANHTSTDANFTYLSDLNNAKSMSSVYDLNITAKKENNDTAENYKDGCAAQAINLTINYKFLNGNGDEINITNLSEVQYFIDNGDVNASDIEDKNFTADINSSSFNDDNNGTANVKIHINFDRKYNKPVNPFFLKLNDIELIDANGTKEENGTIDKKSTFLYAKVKSSKYIYQSVEASVNTPITIEVYCDKWPASSSNCPAVDTLNGKTEESQWFISTLHNVDSSNDGEVKLTNVDGGNPNVIHGSDTEVKVSGNAPETKTVDFDAGTSDWLIYNKEANEVPSPFYRVKFIYNNGSWSGHGKTGNIVGGDINKNIKSNSRTEW